MSTPKEEHGVTVGKNECAHDIAYLEADRITILQNILPAEIDTVENDLLVTRIEMLEDSMCTIGEFSFTNEWYAKRSRNLNVEMQLSRRAKLFREDSHYAEDAQGVAVPTDRGASRNKSIGEIRRTLSGLAPIYQYDKILVSALEYEKEYASAPVTHEALQTFTKEPLLAKIVSFPCGSVYCIGTFPLKTKNFLSGPDSFI